MKLLIRRILLSLFSYRVLALVRWDLHFISVRFRNLLSCQPSKCSKRIERAARPLYLNLGSGPRGKSDDHWFNVDGYDANNVQCLMDFCRPWPFPHNSFDGIFCEHVFEHFDFEQGAWLLREALRVLRPGGAIRIIVPDGEKIIGTYRDSPSELLAHRDTGKNFAMDAVNSYFRQRYEHQYIYDWASLEHQLIQAGFQNAARVSYGEGNVSKSMLLDDQAYLWESLYVEASKPDRES